MPGITGVGKEGPNRLAHNQPLRLIPDHSLVQPPPFQAQKRSLEES